MQWPPDEELAVVIAEALAKSSSRYPDDPEYRALVQGHERDLGNVVVDDHFNVLNVARLVREYLQGAQPPSALVTKAYYGQEQA